MATVHDCTTASDQILAARTRECLNEISRCLRGPEILPHLIKHRVLDFPDGEFLLNDSVPKQDKANRLLSLLHKKQSGFCLFVK